MVKLRRLKLKSLSLTKEEKIKRRVTRVGAFEDCVASHVGLRMFNMRVLASRLPFLANRNTELVVPLLFWPVNCIKIEGHVALLIGPTVRSLNCDLTFTGKALVQDYEDWFFS